MDIAGKMQSNREREKLSFVFLKHVLQVLLSGSRLDALELRAPSKRKARITSHRGGKMQRTVTGGSAAGRKLRGETRARPIWILVNTNPPEVDDGFPVLPRSFPVHMRTLAKSE